MTNRLYEALTSESQLGHQARSLVAAYPKTAHILLWCSVAEKDFRNDEVHLWRSPQGLDIKFTDNEQTFCLGEISDWVDCMKHLEDCLPPMHSMPDR